MIRSYCFLLINYRSILCIDILRPNNRGVAQVEVKHYEVHSFQSFYRSTISGFK